MILLVEEDETEFKKPCENLVGTSVQKEGDERLNEAVKLPGEVMKPTERSGNRETPAIWW